jgi:serine phosphatase RsbU (regulator of sigma subunit)
MFKLRDFLHIPQLDPLFKEMISDNTGLIIISGLDSHPIPSSKTEILLPSGRGTIFNIVLQEILSTHTEFKATILASDKSTGLVPRQLKRRTNLLSIDSPTDYPAKIFEAIRRLPDLLVVDQLTPENFHAVFEAAQRGVFVLTQLDSIFCGAEAIRYLLDLGAPEDKLETIRWILSVHRLSKLCPSCKKTAEFAGYGELFQAQGCDRCRKTGRLGEITAFDVYHRESGCKDSWDCPSQLPLEQYILNLVQLGHLPLEDYNRFEKDLLHRTYRLLTANERALEETNVKLKRRLIELEASNRVLERRTSVLVSLQDIVQLMNTSNSLNDLANSLCRKANKLCEADRTILYYQRDRNVEILAVAGWGENFKGRMLDPKQVFSRIDPQRPTSYLQLPPGISLDMGTDVQIPIKAGLKLPLIVQEMQVGLMIVQSTTKDLFTPGEKALLETFAHQASVAIQRAVLIDDLQAKIFELQAAQTELIKKERLEHELSLARQVQQSMLPIMFPAFAGYRFAARNEPAREVGGDFYDVIDLGPDHFGIVIGDVSDKGMPAALYMALTRSLLVAEALRERSPRQILLNVNKLLMEFREPRQFVSVFFGIIEKATRRLTYCRAGHEYPLWLRDGAVKTLTGEGSILGVLDNDHFHLSEEHVTLSSGDRIVLYTDGLTDAMNKDGLTFELKRMLSLLESISKSSAHEICRATFDEILAFQQEAEQYDDMTLLVIEII